jgi:hypothetical protein
MKTTNLFAIQRVPEEAGVVFSILVSNGMVESGFA